MSIWEGKAMIVQIHLIFLVIAVITSIVGCQRGIQEHTDHQLVSPQQIREIQGQYLNARGDRLNIGTNGEIQWTQNFAFETGICRETLTGRLLQFEAVSDPSHPLATMALRFETIVEPHLDGTINGRQVVFRNRPEMLQACRDAFSNRPQRFRQRSQFQLPALPTPPPAPSQQGRMMGGRPVQGVAAKSSRGGRAFQIRHDRSARREQQFQPEGISLPVSRISQDVLVLALFAHRESDFGRINDVFVKSTAFTRPIDDLISKSLTSNQFSLASDPSITLSFTGHTINMLLDAERSCGLRLTAPLAPSQITYPTDVSLIPNIQFGLRLTSTVNVVQDNLSNNATCSTLLQFFNNADSSRSIQFETRGRDGLVLVTGSEGGLLFNRQQ